MSPSREILKFIRDEKKCFVLKEKRNYLKHSTILYTNILTRTHSKFLGNFHHFSSYTHLRIKLKWKDQQIGISEFHFYDLSCVANFKSKGENKRNSFPSRNKKKKKKYIRNHVDIRMATFQIKFKSVLYHLIKFISFQVSSTENDKSEISEIRSWIFPSTCRKQITLKLLQR